MVVEEGKREEGSGEGVKKVEALRWEGENLLSLMRPNNPVDNRNLLSNNIINHNFPNLSSLKRRILMEWRSCDLVHSQVSVPKE
jgi:hypothetical protein